VTSDEAEFVYKCTDYYNPAAEHSIIWNDPEIGIEWPIVEAPLLSKKDVLGETISGTVGLVYK
jgi:dTDP-4-dehydrorhamnose 3,5-epimerase